jgi:NTE family protein
MLRALYEHDLRPDLMVGTSAGAMNAAFAATRGATVAAAAELEAVWRGLTRWRVFPPDPLTAGLGLLGARAHAVPSSSLRRLVTDHLQIERLEDAPVPLHVVTTESPRCEIQPTDFSQADELIAEALHDARRALTRSRYAAPQVRAA